MRQSRKANRQSVENGALQNSQRLRMKVAYADPPYLGCGSRYVAYHRDGFADFADMTKWFRETHGLPFIGQLIEW